LSEAVERVVGVGVRTVAQHLREWRGKVLRV
jgi:hypothetical protein